MSARVPNVKDFHQTKLDSEINAPFLFKEQCDPTFYFIDSMRTISLMRKKMVEIYGYFFAK